MQNILKEIIFWALLASCDFHNNEVQCPRKALLADAWSEILAGLSELGLTVITSLCTPPQLENCKAFLDSGRQFKSIRILLAESEAAVHEGLIIFLRTFINNQLSKGV